MKNRISLCLAMAALFRTFNSPHAATNVDFFPSQVTAQTEDAGPLLIFLERTGDLSSSNTVYYTRSDFPKELGTLTFRPGETLKRLDLAFADNGIVDGDKSFSLALLSVSDGPFIQGNNSIELLILDNEEPNLVDAAFALNSRIESSRANAPYASVNALVLQPDGKIVIGGQFDQIHGRPAGNLARLNIDGSVDETFHSDTALFIAGHPGLNLSSVSCLALQRDGRILAGGQFNSINGIPCGNIARLNPDGAVDTTFNAAFTRTNQIAIADPTELLTLVLQENGKILAGGRFDHVNGVARVNLARLNEDGSLDLTFHAATELSQASNVKAFLVQTDGKILVGGTFATINDSQASCVARLLPSGSLDPDFWIGSGICPGRFRSQYGVSAIFPVQGGALIAGTFEAVQGYACSNVAKLSDDGSFAGPWYPLWSDPQRYDLQLPVTSLARAGDGKIYAAGFQSGSDGAFAITRLNESGSVDPDFPTLSGSGNAVALVRAMVVETNGDLLVAGELGNAFISRANAALSGAQFQALNRLRADATVNGFRLDIGCLATSEAINEVTLTIHRLGNSIDATHVLVETRDITAIGGINYTPIRKVVDFAPLETLKTISIPILRDGVATEDLHFEVLLKEAAIPNKIVNSGRVSIQNSDIGLLATGLGYSPDGVSLQVAGIGDGSFYLVEVSVDLSHWEKLQEFKSTAGWTVGTVGDPGAAHRAIRFYRLLKVEQGK